MYTAFDSHPTSKYYHLHFTNELTKAQKSEGSYNCWPSWDS